MYVNVYVPKSGGSVVPKSDVYKCSDPYVEGEGDRRRCGSTPGGVENRTWGFHSPSGSGDGRSGREPLECCSPTAAARNVCG